MASGKGRKDRIPKELLKGIKYGETDISYRAIHERLERKISSMPESYAFDYLRDVITKTRKAGERDIYIWHFGRLIGRLYSRSDLSLLVICGSFYNT